MAAILHCLFRHCFEQNRNGDDDHDSDDPDYPSGGGGGAGNNSTPLSAAVARRRGGGSGSLRRSGSPFVEEDHGGSGSRPGDGDGEHAGCEHADPTSPGAAQPGGDGGGGFFRRWLHHGEVGGGGAPADSADGTENLLRGGGGGARRSYPPLAPPGGDPAVAMMDPAASASSSSGRPPLLPPDFRGLLGLVRRTSADLQAKLSENFARREDDDTEKDGLTSTGSIHSHSLREAVEFDFAKGKELPTISLNEVVVPGSELQRAMARQMSARGEGADGGGCAPGDECVICMDGFSPENPRMPTLCGCGENKTYFHLPCLYQWIDQCRECPSCRKKLVWEEF